MFKFEFDNFHEWYFDNLARSDLFEKNCNMAVYIINKSMKYEKLSQKLIKKRQLAPLSNKNEGYLAAFRKNNVKDIAKIKFIKNEDKYPNGLYCVLDDDGLYAVFPTETDGILCADHLSFMKDNVHQTTYTPSSRNKNIGAVMHVPRSELLDGTELPLSGYNTNIFKKMHIYKDDILDICRLPQIAKEIQSGGTGKMSATRKIAKSKAKSHTISSEISPLLEQLLLFNDISSMKIFCIKNKNDEWIVTTFAETTDRTYNDITFTTNSKNWSAIQKDMCKTLKETRFVL